MREKYIFIYIMIYAQVCIYLLKDILNKGLGADNTVFFRKELKKSIQKILEAESAYYNKLINQ
ncbi:hypothetical protein [Enterococcus sp. AZ186]|uniref:hypothetical protein n=2 Tax=unclassified Enterococcus TaxID=2608891 RepID=UPI003F686563